MSTLPKDSKTRKGTPVFSGCMNYFPLALAAVARVSVHGNNKHNPGQPLHWSRGKSADHKDCIARHLIDAGEIDPETGELHDAEVAWRSLANLQEAEEKRLGLPFSKGSKAAESTVEGFMSAGAKLTGLPSPRVVEEYLALSRAVTEVSVPSRRRPKETQDQGPASASEPHHRDRSRPAAKRKPRTGPRSRHSTR